MDSQKDRNRDGRKKVIRITTVPVSLKVLLRHQLKFLSAHFNLVAVSSPGPLLNEVGLQEGVRVAGVAMTRQITPLRDLVALFRLYRLFRLERPSIVHTHTPKAGLLGMVAAWAAGVPVRLHTVAGLPLMEASGMRRRLMAAAERLTYRCSTGVYPNSHSLAGFLERKGFCRAGKLKVLGNGSSNGVDLEYFRLCESLVRAGEEVREELKIPAGHFVFIFAGRLVRDKGINELVAAFVRLRAERADVVLLLVGPYEAELDPLAGSTTATIDAGEGIVRVGFREDIRPYLAISHALVFPSYREGFPNVPMQAGCFSLPSIVTDINGCNEIVRHGVNGLVVPPKDEDALLSAMRTISADAGLYERLRSNARPYIHDRYDQRRLWRLVLEEYMLQLNNVRWAGTNDISRGGSTW